MIVCCFTATHPPTVCFAAALRDWEKQLDFEAVVNRFVVHEVLKFHETQVRCLPPPPVVRDASNFALVIDGALG